MYAWLCLVAQVQPNYSEMNKMQSFFSNDVIHVYNLNISWVYELLPKRICDTTQISITRI